MKLYHVWSGTIIAGLVAPLVLSGCNAGNPCASIAPPTPAEITAAQQGAEIERDVIGGECELQGTTWVFDRDSSKRRVTTIVTTPSPVKPKPSEKPRPTQAAKPTRR